MQIIVQGDHNINQAGGSYNTAKVTSNNGTDLDFVLAQIDQLKQQALELPEDQDDARDELAQLEIEVKQPTASNQIKGRLKRLAGMAQGSVNFATSLATLFQKLKELQFI